MLDGIDILVIDFYDIWLEFMVKLLEGMGVIVICNKVDIFGESVGMDEYD